MGSEPLLPVSGPDLEAESLIPPEQRDSFRRANNQLISIEGGAIAASAANEVIKHTSLGVNQLGMSGVDLFMGAFLRRTATLDERGEHKRATWYRRWLYRAHIGVAAVGGAEALRLFLNGAAAEPENLVISGLVGVMNSRIVYDQIQHYRQRAHTQAPDITMAYTDPIEAVEDEHRQFPDAQTVYEQNRKGTFAIAWTNIAESASGVFGALAGFAWNRAAALAAIGGNAAVVYIMKRQINRETEVFEQQTTEQPKLRRRLGFLSLRHYRESRSAA